MSHIRPNVTRHQRLSTTNHGHLDHPFKAFIQGPHPRNEKPAYTQWRNPIGCNPANTQVDKTQIRLRWSKKLLLKQVASRPSIMNWNKAWPTPQLRRAHVSKPPWSRPNGRHHHVALSQAATQPPNILVLHEI
ncbi:hypothetical protein IHE45_16G016200 [Dioscorea alata]|uniref:Uncharacterized protein n=1 Tax=Dioscorea alata TaxID=55571 RepID=A0ACB7UG64_DIOAL|nr:hypothetical protein IHE45_16G016200 [Dioscorea alata]